MLVAKMCACTVVTILYELHRYNLGILVFTIYFQVFGTQT